MEASGHPRAQSIAAALSNARRHPRKANGGGIAGYAAGGSPSWGDLFLQSMQSVLDKDGVPKLPGSVPTIGTQSATTPSWGSIFLPTSPVNTPTPSNPSPPSTPGIGGVKFTKPDTPTPPSGYTPETLVVPPRPAPAPSPVAPPPEAVSRSGNPADYNDPDYWNNPGNFSYNTESTGGDARGGRIGDDDRAEPHYDVGGAVGYLHGDTPGRTDVLHIAPPGGSYVIPADVVAGLGEGNSLAGAAILNKAFQVGPWGTKLTTGAKGRGVGIPKFPAQFEGTYLAPAAKRGGAQKNNERGDPTPILAAAGEYIVEPRVVRQIGGGDMTRGHNILDGWVLKKRGEVADKMKKLQPPKKS